MKIHCLLERKKSSIDNAIKFNADRFRTNYMLRKRDYCKIIFYFSINFNRTVDDNGKKNERVVVSKAFSHFRTALRETSKFQTYKYFFS